MTWSYSNSMSFYISFALNHQLSTTATKKEHCSDFDLAKDNTYLTLKAEPCGVSEYNVVQVQFSSKNLCNKLPRAQGRF